MPSRAQRHGEFVKKIFPGPHRKLLLYLNQLAQSSCPQYLHNERDDIAQIALIRLISKIDSMEEDLRSCRALTLQAISENRTEPLMDLLGRCLEEIEKSCDRMKSKQIRAGLRKCISWTQQGQATAHAGEILNFIDKCLHWLCDKDGKDIFADYYIQRGTHWAIIDVKKRYIRLAEVSTEETDEAHLESPESTHAPSWQRVLEIREEVSECLNHLDEAKRRPTLLALLGYQYSEIAEFLDLSIPQTDSRVRRGKAFLRNCLNLKGVFP